MRLLVAGPPASGKGTQCRALCERFGLVHVSAGDLLRAALRDGNLSVSAAGM